jgi:hypothetical protein
MPPNTAKAPTAATRKPKRTITAVDFDGCVRLRSRLATNGGMIFDFQCDVVFCVLLARLGPYVAAGIKISLPERVTFENKSSLENEDSARLEK